MQQKRFFLDPGGQWVDQADDSTVRLDSRTERVEQVQNTFYRKNDGRWDVVGEEELNPIERGLVWQVWKTAVNGRAYLAFRGVRAIDRPLESLFKKLTVLNSRGQEVENISQAGYQFLLAAEDAKIFTGRIAKIGGKIIQSNPAPDEALTAIAAAEKALAQIQNVIKEEALIIAESEEGDLSRISEIDNNDNEIDALSIIVEEQANICLANSMPLLLPEKTEEEKKQGRELVARAEAAIDGARMLSEARQISFERPRELVQHDGINGPARLLLARELGRMARQDGYEVKTTTEGVKIKLGERWLEVGEKIELGSE